MAVDHEVHVHVPESWQHAHAFRRDHLCTAGHDQCADRAHGANACALDQNHTVLYDGSAVSIDECAAHQRLEPARLCVQGRWRMHPTDTGAEQDDPADAYHGDLAVSDGGESPGNMRHPLGTPASPAD